MNYSSCPNARMVTRQSIVSLQMLNTGLRETASRRLICGKTMRKFAKIDMNIIIAGMITRSTGQFRTEIDTIIDSIEKPDTAV